VSGTALAESPSRSTNSDGKVRYGILRFLLALLPKRGTGKYTRNLWSDDTFLRTSGPTMGRLERDGPFITFPPSHKEVKR
jgi:hypothetical protein